LKKTFVTCILSIAVAATLFSLVFFLDDDSFDAQIGLGLYGGIYLLIQFFVGLNYLYKDKEKDKELGQGLIIGAVIILIIGIATCTRL
jgi:hypothetical protein